MMYPVLVWAHVLAAATWVGSMVFFVVAIAPILRDPERRTTYGPLLRAMGARYRKLAWACLVILAITGIEELRFRLGSFAPLGTNEFWATPFGVTLARKLVLVVLVIASTIAHEALVGRRAMERLGADPTSTAMAPRRRAAAWLGRAALMFSIAILYFAVRLVRG